MEEALIKALLAQPYLTLTTKEYVALGKLADRYPYYATLHALMVKQTLMREDANARPYLVKAAAYAPDRLVLRHLVESKAPGAKSLKSYAKPPKPIMIVTDAQDEPAAPEVWVVESDQAPQPKSAPTSLATAKPAWMQDLGEKPIWLPDDEADVSHQDAAIGAWPGLDTEQHVDHATKGENEPEPFKGYRYAKPDPELLPTDDELAEKGGAFMVEANEEILPDVDDELILANDEVDDQLDNTVAELPTLPEEDILAGNVPYESQKWPYETVAATEASTPSVQTDHELGELAAFPEEDILAGKVPYESQKWPYETVAATEASTPSVQTDHELGELPAFPEEDILAGNVPDESQKWPYETVAATEASTPSLQTDHELGELAAFSEEDILAGKVPDESQKWPYETLAATEASTPSVQTDHELGELAAFSEEDILAGNVPDESQKMPYETVAATESSTPSFFEEVGQLELLPTEAHNSDDLIHELLVEVDKYRKLKSESQFDFGPSDTLTLSAEEQFAQELNALIHDDTPAADSTDLGWQVDLISHVEEVDVQSEGVDNDPENDPNTDPEINPELDPELDPEINPEINPELNPELDPEINPELNPDTDLTFDDDQPLTADQPSMAIEVEDLAVIEEYQPEFPIQQPTEQPLSIYEQLLAEAEQEEQAIDELLQNIINEDIDEALIVNPSAEDVELATEPITKLVNEAELSDDEIIDKFLVANPKIGPVKQTRSDDPVYDLSAQNTTLADEDMTENLAQIMVKQGKLDKAIEIYCKLILKNPEKTPYFASRINALAGAMGEK